MDQVKTKKTDTQKAWVVLAAQPLLFLGMNLMFAVSAMGGALFITTRVAYIFNTLILPVNLVLAGAIGVLAWRKEGTDRRLLRVSALCFMAALGCFGARIYATHIEPNRLVIRHVTIETPKLTRVIKVLHITDIQADRIGRFQEKAFDKMRELNPDIVIHTGDLLQPIPPATIESESAKLAGLFRTLSPRLGMFCIYGNFDLWVGKDSLADYGGLRMLNSEDAVVDLGDVKLRIMGLSLAQSFQTSRSSDTRRFVQAWLKETDKGDFTVLAGHLPDYILGIEDLDVDLCLAGHIHGGQIRLPFLGPIVTLSQVPREWARGYRKVGKTRINVSAGLGNEHSHGLPKIRVLCPPEMTLIEIRPAGD